MRAVLLSVCLGFATPAVAAAQTSDASIVEELLREGVERRQAGRDEEALGFFRLAYDRDPSPRVLAQIALAQLALHRWSDSHRDLTQVLAAATDRWVQTNRPQLEASRREAESHLARVRVRGPAGVSVTVDGADVGALPLADLFLDAGRHDVRAPSLDFARTVQASEGSVLDVAIVAASEPPPPPPPPGGAASPGEADEVPIVPWVLVGTGAALGLGAVGTTIHALSLPHPWPCSSSCEPAAELPVPYVVQPILYVSAAALVGTGIALLVTADSPRPSVACAPTAGEVTGLACSGRF